MRLFLRLLPVLIFAALALGFLFGLGLDPRAVPSALIDKPAPEFNLPGIDEGAPGLATTDLKGGISVVNVFASWCGPCRVEHPLWMDLAGSDAFRLIGLNYKDKPEAARQWLKDLGDPYEKIGSDLDGRVGIDWGVTGVPETFIVDAEGRIRAKHIGPMTEEAWEETMMPVIRSIGG